MALTDPLGTSDLAWSPNCVFKTTGVYVYRCGVGWANEIFLSVVRASFLLASIYDTRAWMTCSFTPSCPFRNIICITHIRLPNYKRYSACRNQSHVLRSMRTISKNLSRSSHGWLSDVLVVRQSLSWLQELCIIFHLSRQVISRRGGRGDTVVNHVRIIIDPM